jgi:hypothetical protein
MRVRCRYCRAEYDTPVTQTALGFVDRCDRCGRAGLEEVGDDDRVAGEPPPDDTRVADEPPAREARVTSPDRIGDLRDRRSG